MHWLRLFVRQGLFKYDTAEKRLLRKHFDLLRNSHSTVLVYADECELLVFGAFLNSPKACRKWFFDTLWGQAHRLTPTFIIEPKLFYSTEGASDSAQDGTSCGRTLCRLVQHTGFLMKRLNQESVLHNNTAFNAVLIRIRRRKHCCFPRERGSTHSRPRSEAYQNRFGCHETVTDRSRAPTT